MPVGFICRFISERSRESAAKLVRRFLCSLGLFFRVCICRQRSRGPLVRETPLPPQRTALGTEVATKRVDYDTVVSACRSFCLGVHRGRVVSRAEWHSITAPVVFC